MLRYICIFYYMYAIDAFCCQPCECTRFKLKQQIFIDQTRQFHFDFVTSFCHTCLSSSSPSASSSASSSLLSPPRRCCIRVYVCAQCACPFLCSRCLHKDGLDLVCFYWPKRAVFVHQRTNEIEIKHRTANARVGENEEIKQRRWHHRAYMHILSHDKRHVKCFAGTQLKWRWTFGSFHSTRTRPFECIDFQFLYVPLTILLKYLSIDMFSKHFNLLRFSSPCVRLANASIESHKHNMKSAAFFIIFSGPERKHTRYCFCLN